MPALESTHIIMYFNARSQSDDCTEASVTPEPRLCAGFQNQHINAPEEALYKHNIVCERGFAQQ